MLSGDTNSNWQQAKITETPKYVKNKSNNETANEAMEEILDGKDLNITELNHLIYEAATVITEEINGTGEYNYKHRSQRHPRGLDTYRGA